MARALLGIVTLCALALAVGRGPAMGDERTLKVGESVPAFLLDALDGGAVTSNFHGQPAYINVFATWCPPCRREFPSILQHAKEYRNRIAFLFVDEREPANRVKDFAVAFGLGVPVALDAGQFGNTFDVRGLPESIFIDRHGIVQYVYRGNIPDDVLAAQLSRLAGGDASVAAAQSVP